MATAKTLDVTPYLIVEDATALIDFVKSAFDAVELERSTGSQGGVHCELRIGETKVMVGGGRQVRGRTKPGALHVYVPDVDAVHRRAVKAGARSLYSPTGQADGSRDGSVQDRFGNHWYIATQSPANYRPEGLPDVMPYLHPHGAARLIDFLVEGLGGEVLAKHEANNAVVHAKVRLGDAVIELGEAHGQYQPMPMVMFVRVDNADAAFKRAVKAGAEELSPVSDLPYGRSGAVEDVFGNQWFMTAPKKA